MPGIRHTGSAGAPAAPLLLVEAAAQFHAFFRDVLAQESWVR